MLAQGLSADWQAKLDGEIEPPVGFNQDAALGCPSADAIDAPRLRNESLSAYLAGSKDTQ